MYVAMALGPGAVEIRWQSHEKVGEGARIKGEGTMYVRLRQGGTEPWGAWASWSPRVRVAAGVAGECCHTPAASVGTVPGSAWLSSPGQRFSKWDMTADCLDVT